MSPHLDELDPAGSNAIEFVSSERESEMTRHRQLPDGFPSVSTGEFEEKVDVVKVEVKVAVARAYQTRDDDEPCSRRSSAFDTHHPVLLVRQSPLLLSTVSKF